MYEVAPELARRELLADLRSTAWSDDRERSARAWASRPAILRRVALALASLIRPETDRIVTAGPAASALGAAVSLTSGIPFTVASPSGATVETTARETVALISLFGDELPRGVRGSSSVYPLALFASGASPNPAFVFEDDWTRPQHQISDGATE